jgi:Ca2+-binding RTX toxin-like protein
VGGDGTDTLSVGTSGTAFTIATVDSWARVQTVETIKAVANSSAISITLHANAATAGITTVDISAGTAASGNVVSATAYTGTNITIVGAAGSNTLTGGAFSDTITGGAASDTIVGGAGADSITGADGIDVLDGGADSDTYVYDTFALFSAGATVIDSIADTSGTADAIQFAGASATDLTFSASGALTRITGVEKITTTPHSGAVSITYIAANLTSINTIDLSGDTTTTGTNVISSTGVNGISTIIGSAGIDTITLGADAPATTITGGAGADTLSIATTNAVSVNDADGIAITVSGSTVSALTTTGALVATTITGGTGVDTITLAGAVSNVATITGGTGLDAITLGAAHTGGVTLVLTAESAAPTSATTVDSVVTNYIKSLDKISAPALILGVQTAAAASGVATLTSGVATFHADDNDLAKHFAAVAAALQATPGATAIWTEGADSYIYVSDGTLTNAATDYAVKLVGVTAGALTIAGNMITAIA